MQIVPAPAKEHIRYLEPQCLQPGSLQLLALQTLFWCQLKLTAAQRYHALLAMEAQLFKLQKLPDGAPPALLSVCGPRGLP